jgi:predicted acyltransferase
VRTGERLLSLDVFRGLTIAGMILVNNPGSWSQVYPPLLHAEWHGWTPTDLIFPFFLFIVGVAMSLSFARADDPSIAKILVRSAILFGLGLFMAAYPRFDLLHLRIPGVLQRIAVCYLATSLLVLHASRKTLYGVLAFILGAYFLVLGGDLTVEGNLAARVDLTGERLRAGGDGHETATVLFAWGWGLILGGLVWSIWLPINKNLWTSSYAVFTAGAAAVLFGLLFWMTDVLGWRGWTAPFVVLGRNALALFVVSGLLVKTLALIRIGDVSFSRHVYVTYYASLAPPKLASLLYALTHLGLLFGLLAWLYRRRLFLKA